MSVSARTVTKKINWMAEVVVAVLFIAAIGTIGFGLYYAFTRSTTNFWFNTPLGFILFGLIVGPGWYLSRLPVPPTPPTNSGTHGQSKFADLANVQSSGIWKP